MTSYLEKEYQGIVDAYQKAGGNRSALLGKATARLVIHENRVLDESGVDGLRIETKETGTGVEVYLVCWWSTIRSVGYCSGIMSVNGRTDIDYKGTEQITDSKRGTRKALDYAGGSQSHGSE